MKQLLSILLFLFSAGDAIAQHRVVPLLQGSQNFKINGGGRAQFGGKSRIVIPIQVPKNAIYIYYTISTKNGSSGNFPQAVQLVAQLASMISSTATIPLQTLSALAGRISQISREAVVDVFLFPSSQ